VAHANIVVLEETKATRNSTIIIDLNMPEWSVTAMKRKRRVKG
jgi:hypothetical protein